MTKPSPRDFEADEHLKNLTPIVKMIVKGALSPRISIGPPSSDPFVPYDFPMQVMQAIANLKTGDESWILRNLPNEEIDQYEFEPFDVPSALKFLSMRLKGKWIISGKYNIQEDDEYSTDWQCYWLAETEEMVQEMIREIPQYKGLEHNRDSFRRYLANKMVVLIESEMSELDTLPKELTAGLTYEDHWQFLTDPSFMKSADEAMKKLEVTVMDVPHVDTSSPSLPSHSPEHWTEEGNTVTIKPGWKSMRYDTFSKDGVLWARPKFEGLKNKPFPLKLDKGSLDELLVKSMSGLPMADQAFLASIVLHNNMSETDAADMAKGKTKMDFATIYDMMNGDETDWETDIQ